MMNQVYTSYVIVRRLPTQDSVTWVNTLWNEVTTTFHSKCGINQGLIKRGSTVDH
jgi:hypothetical protein